jgi:translocation and assembly module TamB
VSLIILALSIALSSIGTQWAINYVNDGDFGVAVDYESGSFYSELNFNQIRINQPGLNVEVSDLSLDIGLSCIFAGEVCINHVRLNRVTVDLGDMPAQEESATATENKLIKLPVLLTLNELSVGEVLVSQNSAQLLKLKGFLLALSFQDQLNISKLNVDSLDVRLPKSAQAELIENKVSPVAEQKPREWLSAIANYRYEPIVLPEVYIPIELTLKNSMLRNICIRQQAQDDSITTIFCNDSLALNLAINNQKVDTSIVMGNLHQGTETPMFTPLNLKMTTAVNFAKKFEHNLTLTARSKDTPKQDTPVFDNTSGFQFKSQGNINKLNVALSHLPSQQKVLGLASTLQLSKPTLPLELDIKFEELSAVIADDLQALIPSLSDEVISQVRGVSLLQAKIGGDMQGYRLTSMVKMQEIMGVENFELNALVKPMSAKQGARSLIDIQKLNLSGSIGELDYAGKATLAPKDNDLHELSFNGSVNLESIQLSKLDPALDSLISGELPHSFIITEISQSVAVNGARLSGAWQNLPLLLVADAALEKSGNVKVDGVRLTQGDNQLNVQGNLYSKTALESIAQLGLNFPDKNQKRGSSSLDFTIDLNALSDIYPSLDGQVFAKGNVSGAIETPKIVVQANVKELRAADTRLEEATIELSVNMAEKLASKAQISISNLFAGGQNIPQLEILLSGNENEQSLRLSIPEGKYITEQFFRGQLNADSTRWSGKWLEGKVLSSFAELILQDQPDLTVNLQPFSLYLAGHCWEGRGDRLCTEDINASEQKARTKIALDYNVMNEGVAKLLPNFDIDASALNVNIDLDVDWQKQQGLNFSADVLSENAVLVSDGSKVRIEDIVANVQGTPKNINSSFSFSSTEAGRVVINSQLDLASQPYQHKGSINIDQFAVSYFASFVTAVKDLNGDINANITFDGPIEKPSLQGQLVIADGAVVLKEYPLKLADYSQKVIFDGSKADFSGQFMLGEGRGSVEGDVDFTDELIVNIMVAGDKLDIAYETYKFKVSPDLKIKLSPELLSISGKVDVPYARVKIKSLPPSAKSPSQDIIVVDEKKVAKQGQLPIDVDLNILIDKDKKGEVKLDALDLKAELSGDLRVQVDAQNTRVNGLVQILKGSYEAYSQVLQIRKGEITFSGQPDVPAFDIEAIRNPLNTNDGVIAGIRVTGNAIKPSVDLFSEPSMDQAKQLSYLISGAGTFGGGSGNSEETTLVNALVSFGVGQSENGIGSLGQKLGVKDLNLQTAGQGQGTKVELSGQLAEGVKITYGVGVFDSLSEVSVHYQLLPQVYLEAVSGVNNTLDLYYQITSKD